jgi:CDP-glucose 4,6-dehydratase
MEALFDNTFSELTVLVTGHTGFKGSWLTCWLAQLGAQVIGFSLEEPPTKPSNFQLSGIHQFVTDIRGDISDIDSFQRTIETYQPTLIFHLAAQPIVLRAYKQPKITFDTNSGGTVNILEAIRRTNSVRALVSITTDKVYRNQGWLWGYREDDLLGDAEPYGASKAMAELAIESYRRSFFSRGTYEEHGVAIASARAGNVIGGGDFADFRLVPDCMRALMAGEPVSIRNPQSVRPWQHVLEPLSGYLLLGMMLLKEGPSYSEAWNFGPAEKENVTTRMVVEKLIALWGSGSWSHEGSADNKTESTLLRLSWEKAATRLHWQPVYTIDEALGEISAWFKAYLDKQEMYAVCQDHIAAYAQRAREKELIWAC